MGRGVPVARRWRAIGAAAVLLAACRSDGARGHAFTRASTYEPQGIEPWRLEVPRAAARTGTRAERDETAKLVAITRAIVEAHRAAGSTALGRVSSRPLREHAAEAVETAERQLEALRTLAAARGLDVATAALDEDPVMVAQREAAARDLARLQSLAGKDLARAWLAGELSRLELLGALAGLSVRLSPDVAAGNVFRMIAHEARTQAERAVTMAELEHLSQAAGSVGHF